MRADVQADFDWGRWFLPEIKRICGEHLIAEAPYEEDAEHATDLIVLRLEAVRIACRIRRHTWLSNCGGEFTIRSRRPSGADTELRKIISGWGNFMFYGFAGSGDQPPLAAWSLIDLSLFRLWRATHVAQYHREPGREKPNHDGTRFRIYQLSDLPRAAILAFHHPSLAAKRITL